MNFVPRARERLDEMQDPVSVAADGRVREPRGEKENAHRGRVYCSPMRGARFALWRNRSLRFLLGASSTILNGLTGILRNKWFAHHLEASGIGILAQVISSQAWLGTAAGMGLGLPVARAVGTATAANDPLGARRIVWAAFTLLAINGSWVVAGGGFFSAPTP